MYFSFKNSVATICLIIYILNLEICDAYYYYTLFEGQSCLIEETKQIGRCRRLSQCTNVLSELKIKKYPTVCSYDKEEAIVCCKDLFVGPYTTEAPYIFQSTKPPNTLSRVQEDISRKKCLEYTRKPEKPALKPGEFGIAAVGGEDAMVDEFAHMAAIAWYTLNNTLAFNCGGSLISDRFVMTAAHCIKAVGTNFLQEEPSVVRLGSLNLFDDTAVNQPVDVSIKRIISHPEYKSPVRYFDIALLELNDSVTFSSSVRPACLWPEKDFKQYKEAIVTGWGTNVSGGQENTAILQKVNLDIIDDSQCDSLLSRFRNRLWQGIRDHQMCAGVLAGGRDACQGDSGGPLQVKDAESDNNVYHIIGITSFGKLCAQPNLPGVYTRVSHFIPWIEAIVWPEN